MRAALTHLGAGRFTLQQLLGGTIAMAFVLGFVQILPRDSGFSLARVGSVLMFGLLGSLVVLGLDRWLAWTREHEPLQPGEVSLFGSGWIVAGGFVLTFAAQASYPTGAFTMSIEELLAAEDHLASIKRRHLQITLDAAWTCLVLSLIALPMRELRWRITLAALAASYLPFVAIGAGDLAASVALGDRYLRMTICRFGPPTLLPLLFYGALVPTLVVDWQRGYGPRHWLGVALLVALVTKQMYWLGWLQFFLPF